jgi:phosphate transport system substrate-binding protein
MKLTLLFALVLIASGAFAQLSGTYTWGGSVVLAPIARTALGEFQKINPGVKISYEATDSAAGIRSLLDGRYTLAGLSEELDEALKAGGAVATPIGLDGLSVVVNKKLGLSDISRSDLARIFHGDIANWKEVGGKELWVAVIRCDEAARTYSSFYDFFLRSSYPDKSRAFSTKAVVARENGGVAARISAFSGTVGFVSMSYADQAVKVGSLVLTVDGVAPTIDNVIAKKYAGARLLYFVTKGAPVAGSVEKAFIDFVLSYRGQAILRAADLIPIPMKF